jgi:hypothetical protein
MYYILGTARTSTCIKFGGSRTNGSGDYLLGILTQEVMYYFLRGHLEQVRVLISEALERTVLEIIALE